MEEPPPHQAASYVARLSDAVHLMTEHPSPPGEVASPAWLELLEPGQEETLGQTDEVILNCALEAKLSKGQWDEMINQIGAETIEDILVVDADDFHGCDFKPVLRARLEVFQSALWRNYWSKLRERPTEGTSPTSLPLDSKDDVRQNSKPLLDLLDVPRPPPVAQEVTRLSNDMLASLCVRHEPSKTRKMDLKYWFLHAAGHGCQHCVELLVKEMGVNKDSCSDNQKWTAMDFADYYGQEKMKTFLRTL